MGASQEDILRAGGETEYYQSIYRKLMALMQEESEAGVAYQAEPFSNAHQSSLKYASLLKSLHDICLVKMLTEQGGELIEPASTDRNSSQ